MVDCTLRSNIALAMFGEEERERSFGSKVNDLFRFEVPEEFWDNSVNILDNNSICFLLF